MEKDENKDDLIASLMKEREKDKKIIAALMKRVEDGFAGGGNAFSQFQTSLALAKKVDERTRELRKTSDELRYTNDYSEAIIQSIIDGLIVTTKDGVIKSVNDRVCSIFERKKKYFIGKRLDRLIAENKQDRNQVESFLCEIARKGQVKEKEIRLAHGDREVFYLLSGSLLKENEGQGSDLVLLLRDISDIREMEERIEVEKVKSMNSAKLASLGEMAGGIAHEINNPLAIINGTLKILEKRSERGSLSDDVLNDYIYTMNETVKRIVKIVNGLRNLTRTSEECKTENVLVSDIIDDVFGLCGEKFRSNGVKLSFIGGNNTSIICDRVQLSQVLINLLSNAFDAVQEMDDHDMWVRVEVEEKGSYTEIRVLNSGEKIADDIVEKMFNPFYTSKEVGKGTGLGLSLSKSIMEKYQGSLDYDDSLSDTCFSVKIPLSAAVA